MTELTQQIEQLIQAYTRWLQDKTAVRQVTDDWVEITTPYIDRHNDYMQVYAKRRNGGFTITDGGHVIDDLEQSGCVLDTPKRQELLKVTLAGFGIEQEGGQLVVQATQENFPLRKHNLVQAMLAVNDLFYLAQPTVSSLFLEDVVRWLDSSDIRYTPKVKFTGKSGYDHMFDFVIPKSRTQPERIMQAINRPNRDTAEAAAFRWVDTREVRSPESAAFALLNDQEHPVAQGVLDALQSYEVTPVLWSDRGSFRDRFAA